MHDQRHSERFHQGGARRSARAAGVDPVSSCSFLLFHHSGFCTVSASSLRHETLPNPRCGETPPSHRTRPKRNRKLHHVRTTGGAGMVQKRCSFLVRGIPQCHLVGWNGQPAAEPRGPPHTEPKSVRFRTKRGVRCDFPEPPIRVPFSKQASPHVLFRESRGRCGASGASSARIHAVENRLSPAKQAKEAKKTREVLPRRTTTEQWAESSGEYCFPLRSLRLRRGTLRSSCCIVPTQGSAGSHAPGTRVHFSARAV